MSGFEMVLPGISIPTKVILRKFHRLHCAAIVNQGWLGGFIFGDRVLYPSW